MGAVTDGDVSERTSGPGESDPAPGDSGRLHGALSGMSCALAELREMDAPDQLFDAVAVAASKQCGFDRCIVFVVVGDELVAHSVYFHGHDAWAAETLRLGKEPEGRPHLREFIIETELVRRRSAAIVTDAQNDPHTPRALVELTQTRGYVAAPILCEDQVIGFLHADHHFHDQDVDEVDRVILSAFVIGLGLILERQVLRRHLQRQRMQLQALSREISTAAETASVIDFQIEANPADSAPQRAIDLFWDPAVRDSLSVREREVIQLLVLGATNAVIARRLFISESTAKAHVHHILKKLGASNRAEAVAKFLRGAPAPR